MNKTLKLHKIKKKDLQVKLILKQMLKKEPIQEKFKLKLIQLMIQLINKRRSFV